MSVIKFVLNVIWLVISGLWMALAYVVGGILCAITIIGIPFAVAAFRIAGFVVWPFGRTTVEKPGAGAASCAGNVIWTILAGWWITLAHLAAGIGLCLTIIGIPFGWAHFKMIPISLMPLGREVVSNDDPRVLAW